MESVPSVLRVKRQVVLLETIARLAVDRYRLRYRLGDIADLDARLDRLVDARPHARAHAAEKRGSVGRPLVDADALERDLEHRGEDRAPQVAAPAAAAQPR